MNWTTGKAEFDSGGDEVFSVHFPYRLWAHEISYPMLRHYEVISFFSLPNPSSRTMTLMTTQPLTEMSTRNLPGGKGRPAQG
jgi:hypothetical protein